MLQMDFAAADAASIIRDDAMKQKIKESLCLTAGQTNNILSNLL